MELKITVLILGQKIKLLGRKMKVSGRGPNFFLVLKITIEMGQIINLWNYIDPWI